MGGAQSQGTYRIPSTISNVSAQQIAGAGKNMVGAISDVLNVGLANALQTQNTADGVSEHRHEMLGTAQRPNALGNNFERAIFLGSLLNTGLGHVLAKAHYSVLQSQVSERLQYQHS